MVQRRRHSVLRVWSVPANPGYWLKNHDTVIPHLDTETSSGKLPAEGDLAGRIYSLMHVTFPYQATNLVSQIDHK